MVYFKTKTENTRQSSKKKFLMEKEMSEDISDGMICWGRKEMRIKNAVNNTPEMMLDSNSMLQFDILLICNQLHGTPFSRLFFAATTDSA